MNKTQKDMLKHAHPITRKWLMEQFKLQMPMQKIQKIYNSLNLIEGNIYRTWHRDCLEEMKRIKLDTCVPELFTFVSQPNVNLDKALSRAQKIYAKEENKIKQKHIAKMIMLLTKLSKNEHKLYREATNDLLNGAKCTCLEEIATRISKDNEIANEYRLYTKQSIKHYNRLIKLGKQPSIHELYQALDPRSSADPKIHSDQVSLICSTYKNGQDVPADVKEVCFEYIRKCINYTGYFHVNLIEYIFKNEVITEQAYNLFIDAKEIICKNGMAIIPKRYAQKLATKKGIHNKPAVELSDSDLRILKIEQIFS